MTTLQILEFDQDYEPRNQYSFKSRLLDITKTKTKTNQKLNQNIERSIATTSRIQTRK